MIARRFLVLWLLGMLALGVGLAVWFRGGSNTTGTGAAPPEAPLFEEMTAGSGIAFTYTNGEEADLYTILESLGGGVALLDYDRDGLLDIYFPGGGGFSKDPPRPIGRPGRLYRNLGSWRFQDVTDETGLGKATIYTHGTAVADYDRDGWPDLLVTGYGRLNLYRNVARPEGGRRFVDVTEEVGLRDEGWTTSAAWVDLSGNGRPDLYVCRYVDWSFANDPHCPHRQDPSRREVCEPQRFKALPHSLYRNEGGKFVEISADAGLRSDGKGLGVVAVDVNDDGRPDLYVANDASDNFLYLNRGAGKLEEVGVPAGVAVDEHGHFNGSMGVDAGDYDGSGRASLWVTNFQGELHALYLNMGGGRFSYQSVASGIGALGQQNVGFGTGFLDLDNDGWLDLVMVNGHVLRGPVGASFRQKPLLLRNGERQGRRFFSDISKQGGSYFEKAQLGRGLAVGDLDNDGWPDVVVSHSNSPVALLRNDAARSHPGRNWLGLQLVGRDDRPVVGATVTVEAGGRRLTRFVRGGGSYLSSGDPRLLFGLGSAEQVDRIIVRWPWGKVEPFAAPSINRYWELPEGAGRPRSPQALYRGSRPGNAKPLNRGERENPD